MLLAGGWQNRILVRLANEMSRYKPNHYVPQADRLLCCFAGGLAETASWHGWPMRWSRLQPHSFTCPKLIGYRAACRGAGRTAILARLANENVALTTPSIYVPQVKARVLMVATTKDALCNNQRGAESCQPEPACPTGGEGRG